VIVRDDAVNSGFLREPRTALWPVLTLACAAAMAGCTVGPNFTRPTPPVATRYTADAPRDAGAPADGVLQHIDLGREIEGDWWSLFRSDAIDGVVKQALEHNRSLAASTATLQQAGELAVAAGGARYPQIGLTAGVGRQQYGDEFLGGFFNVPPFTYYAIGPTVSYTLDYAGGISRGVEQQHALAEAARHQMDAAYLTVTGQAVMQTLAISSARAQIATVETILSQDRDNLKLVQTAFQDGSVARIDVVSAQSQIASDMALLPPLRQELARAHHALSVVLGRTPANELPPDVDLAHITLPLELPVILPSELAHRRPDILAAEARLHAATSAVGVAESNLYPKIQLSATVGQQSVDSGLIFNGADTAWSLVSGLTMPLFDGGTLRAEKRAAVDAMHASAAAYEQTVLEAFAQVADMLEALNHDAEQLDAQAQAQQAAQVGLDLARASYTEGNAGVLQVLDAQRSYQQARLGYVRAVAQRYLDTVQLFLALGGTNPSDGRIAETPPRG
jgi:NodT family efflux transporter outer membrane factor (OMF) lipoprotein